MPIVVSGTFSRQSGFSLLSRPLFKLSAATLVWIALVRRWNTIYVAPMGLRFSQRVFRSAARRACECRLPRHWRIDSWHVPSTL